MTREQINARLTSAGYKPSPSLRVWTDHAGKAWLWMNAAFNVVGQDVTIETLQASPGKPTQRSRDASPK